MTLKITTIGDGAMATVCSQILAGKSTAAAPVEVVVWGRDAGRLAEMDAARENKRYLPGFKLAENVRFEADGGKAFGGIGGEVAFILCAVPVQYMRGVLA